MTDKIDLTLEHLKILRAESKQNREDVRDLTHHVIAIRNQMADFFKEHAFMYEKFAEHESRLAKIEQRLGLLDEETH